MTTTIAIVGDSHFDSAPGGRFAECVAVHRFIAQDIRARGVDLLIHTGDLLERKSTAVERAAIAEWLTEVADTCPVLAVRGNHDSPVGELAIFNRLRTKYRVVIEEEAALHRLAGVSVLAVAWPQTAQILAAAGVTDRATSDDTARDALRGVLRGLAGEADAHDGPRVLAMHAQVRGSRVSTGQPLIGLPLELGLEDLALARCDFYALGHIHLGLGNEWDVNGAPAAYPGSPRRTAFGETDPKGYILAEFDGPHLVGWERIATPCAGMVLLESDYPAGGALWGSEVRGAEVRYRYTVDADRREEARAAAGTVRDELLADGALSVKVEEVVRPRSTARAPEVAAARDLASKLRLLWSARGETPQPERAARLIALAQQVEGEVRDAAA